MLGGGPEMGLKDKPGEEEEGVCESRVEQREHEAYEDRQQVKPAQETDLPGDVGCRGEEGGEQDGHCE